MSKNITKSFKLIFSMDKSMDEFEKNESNYKTEPLVFLSITTVRFSQMNLFTRIIYF